MTVINFERPGPDLAAIAAAVQQHRAEALDDYKAAVGDFAVALRDLAALDKPRARALCLAAFNLDTCP